MTKLFNNLFDWIKRYPAKFLLFIFIAVIPIVFLIVLTTTKVSESSRFYFEQNAEEKPIYLNKGDLISKEELNEFLTFDITLKSIVRPSKKTVDDEVIYEDGRYIFDISYSKKGTSNDTFEFTWMLDTDWKEMRSTPEPIYISDTTRERSIPYDYELPSKKFGFIKIERPNLYFKIVRKSDGGTTGLVPEDKVYYYKIDLKQFKPDVTDAR